MSSNPILDEALRVIPILEEQARVLQVPSFSPDDAFEIGSLLRSKFLQEHFTQNNGLAISIELFNGDILFRSSVGSKTYSALDDWFWIAGMIRVVARFNRSSLHVGCINVTTSADFGRFGPPPVGSKDGDYPMFGGAVPVWVKGVSVAPVAVVAVLRDGSFQEADHQLVVDAIAEHFGIKDVPTILQEPCV